MEEILIKQKERVIEQCFYGSTMEVQKFNSRVCRQTESKITKNHNK
jgi:hypothetical protein